MAEDCARLKADTPWFAPLPSERHIRLLQITSPRCDKDVEHEKSIDGVCVFHIDTLPEYHALSYTWGRAKATEGIRLSNGTQAAVTQSLKEGLPYILAQCKSDYLFIDQLCVDQGDSTDRNSQVALMATIYSKALVVLIWLGIKIDHQGILVWLLDQLRDQGRVSAFRRLTGEDRIYRGGRDFKVALKSMISKNAADLILATLSDIFKLSWFRRVWVIQEAVLAPRAEFIIGPLVMSPLGLYEILVLARKCRMKGDTTSVIGEQLGCSAFLYMMEIRSMNGAFEKSFQQILENHRTGWAHGSFEATDPRDYVYGILGIRNDYSSVLLPDYTKSKTEVFAQATKHIVESSGSLAILNLCDRPYENAGKNALPSWDPNWSSKGGYKFGIHGLYDKLAFTASANRHCHGTSRGPWLEMKVNGRLIGNNLTVHTDCFRDLRFFITVCLFPSLLHDVATYEILVPVCAALLEARERLGPVLINSHSQRQRALNAVFRWALRRQGNTPGSDSDEISELINLVESSKVLRHLQPPRLRWLRVEETAQVETDELCAIQGVLRRAAMQSIGLGGLNSYWPGGAINTYPRFLCLDDSSEASAGIRALYDLEDDAELFATETGAIGLGHAAAKEGDMIAILHGYDVPAVLRETADGKYRYVTGCYLENAMNGEAVTWTEEEADEITLV